MSNKDPRVLRRDPQSNAFHEGQMSGQHQTKLPLDKRQNLQLPRIVWPVIVIVAFLVPLVAFGNDAGGVKVIFSFIAVALVGFVFWFANHLFSGK